MERNDTQFKHNLKERGTERWFTYFKQISHIILNVEKKNRLSKKQKFNPKYSI